MASVSNAMETENIVDDITWKIQLFLNRIIVKSDESWQQSRINILRNSIIDIERVADHANNICEAIVELKASECTLSDEEANDILMLFDKAYLAYETSLRSLKSKKVDEAEQVRNIEDEVDLLDSQLREKYTIDCVNIAGPLHHTVLIEIIRDLERIGDHANNIADNIIDID